MTIRGTHQQYQKCKPTTSKNIGKNRLKRERNSNDYSGSGTREQARNLKRLAAQEAKIKKERR